MCTVMFVVGSIVRSTLTFPSVAPVELSVNTSRPFSVDRLMAGLSSTMTVNVNILDSSSVQYSPASSYMSLSRISTVTVQTPAFVNLWPKLITWGGP